MSIHLVIRARIFMRYTKKIVANKKFNLTYFTTRLFVVRCAGTLSLKHSPLSVTVLSLRDLRRS